MAVVVSESSPIPSSDHPLDHQPSDSINDQLATLSLHPEKVGTDNNGGHNSKEAESEENPNEIENGGKEEEDEEREKRLMSEFPVRSGVEDCSFYLRTGMCKFGMNCKFNHPPDRRNQGAKMKKGKEEPVDGADENVKGKDESLSKEGQIDCKYFDRPGGCKFGKACKFNHNRKTSGASQLNFLGLPIRPGEKECPYYMRNGSCKFGANCRFDHPDPTSLGPDAISSHSNGGPVVSSNAPQSALAPWSPSPALNASPPYVPLVFPSTQGVPSQIELNAYPAPVYPPPARNMNLPPAYAMNIQPLGRSIYTHQQAQIMVDEFPERPGQPECSYFIKTGNCKYRSACKFHHPKNAKPSACTLSELGLPLRPGESVCSYYNRYGICKYGPACKYDHPVNYAFAAPLALSAVNQSPVLGNSVVTERAMAATS
uniref:C3H1-type domain-containing protein n=1 Tax=Opuntia streptacantha TaxID=393608 RepID=A0A7C8YZD5_OPUST